MRGNIAGTFLQRESRHARRDRARGHDQIFVLREIELIDHAAQQVDIDLPAGSNKTGADFDDDSHNVGLRPERFTFFAAAKLQPEDPAGELCGPSGEGQHLYPAVRMTFWQDEKSCRVLRLCLLPTPPAAFPIA